MLTVRMCVWFFDIAGRLRRIRCIAYFHSCRYKLFRKIYDVIRRGSKTPLIFNIITKKPKRFVPKNVFPYFLDFEEICCNKNANYLDQYLKKGHFDIRPSGPPDNGQNIPTRRCGVIATPKMSV